MGRQIPFQLIYNFVWRSGDRKFFYHLICRQINGFGDIPLYDGVRYSLDTVPFDAIREQLQKILNESELWDKKVCVLQVTSATERTVELRALVSAADASMAWSLRCEVREKLIEFIRDKYAQALPRFRAELGEPKKRRGR